MDIKNDQPLAPLTSFNVGGIAEKLVEISNNSELEALSSQLSDQFWVLGEGANVLISDSGLPGLTVLIRNKGIKQTGNQLTVEAGHNWDELVIFAVSQNLWSLELMSGIPGSVGAAVVGNIAAYGQAVSDTLESVRVFNLITKKTEEHAASDLNLSYRSSSLQNPDLKHLIVVSAKFNLSPVKTTELKYQSALNIAGSLDLDATDLTARRKIILAAREKAGSLLHPEAEKTAGSFYKNPMVPPEVAEHVLSFEENSITKEQIMKTNKIHGGDSHRVSAAHVLLAAGFKRGQTWGKVQLHPDHILKIVNKGGASAQDIYSVHIQISSTVKEKLGINLEPEVKFFGKF